MIFLSGTPLWTWLHEQLINHVTNKMATSMHFSPLYYIYYLYESLRHHLNSLFVLCHFVFYAVHYPFDLWPAKVTNGAAWIRLFWCTPSHESLVTVLGRCPTESPQIIKPYILSTVERNLRVLTVVNLKNLLFVLLKLGRTGNMTTSAPGDGRAPGYLHGAAH